MRTFTAILFLGFFATTVSAQCTGRYFDKQFPEPDVFSDVFGTPVPDFLGKLVPYTVTYGNAEGADLEMYVFEPEGDTEAMRPLIILAFGGSFTAGFKWSPDIVRLCSEFTARGYVTASIDYRLLPGSSPIDSANMLKQVVKAVHDAKAAVRFFYKDAATTNTYRIDTNKIFMGGTSAGAFIGVQMAYLTDTVGLVQWMKEIIASQGGDLEGTSGNAGYSSRIAGVINLAGAIGDTAWIDAGEPPMVSMHGNDDGTVPYCSEIIEVGGNQIIVVDGSATIKRRTARLGIQNSFYTWRNADHVPYVDPQPTSVGPAYMDTTVAFIRDFLYEQMTGCRCDSSLWAIGNMKTPHVYQNGQLVSCGSTIEDASDSRAFCSVSGIRPVFANVAMEVYPNPSTDVINIRKPKEFAQGANAEVYDNLGRLVRTYVNIANTFTINKKDLGAGMFIVKIVPANKSLGVARAKVVFE